VDDFEDLVGERLMIGLTGPTLRDADVAVFRDTRATGVILYRRNFESPAQLLALLGDLESRLGRKLLVSTDHEGGRVVMFGEGVSIFPDNLAVAKYGDETAARRQGQIEGRELRRLGVDLNLGPCVDVLTDVYSPNIGIRSYGADTGLVSRYGRARIEGMRSAGLATCPKHFPGKGHSPLDAHLRLARIESTWSEMRKVHLPPFAAAIAAGAECIMTSHPVYPNLDPAGVPATFSRPIVDCLRTELGFDGIIVSDDLEMGAIGEYCPVGDAAVGAVRAGHDLLLVCHTEAAQREAHVALVAAYRDGALSTDDLEASAERIRRLREAPRVDAGPPRMDEDGAALAAEVARRAVTCIAPGRRPSGNVVAIFPRFSALAPTITIEPRVADERAFLARAFGAVTPETVVVGIEPTDEEIANAAERSRAADSTVLFLFDAHLYASNRRLLDAVQARARKLTVVLLRDPWDARLLAPGVAGWTAYGFRACQLEAVIDRVLAERP
jgi:beta-N-acetylhexosaminidase